MKNPVYKSIFDFFQRHEKQCILEADHNVCLTYAAKKDIEKRFSVLRQPLPIQVIPCCVDLVLFNPETPDTTLKKQLQEELGINETDTVISYLGSLGGWYLTDEMIRFCKQFSERFPWAKFLFISPQPRKEVDAIAAAHGLDPAKIIVRFGKRAEVPTLLSLSTYSVFFIKPCYSKISSSPTKHGELMAMGIPVITNSGVGDVQEINKKYQGGFVVDGFTETDFNIVLNKIGEKTLFDKSLIRRGAQEVYALESGVNKYKDVYEKILLAGDQRL